jgi:hypothetical protein
VVATPVLKRRQQVPKPRVTFCGELSIFALAITTKFLGKAPAIRGTNFMEDLPGLLD